MTSAESKTAVESAANKRGIILTRVSSDPQKDNYSPQTQESACRRYAAENNINPVQVYTEVYSGAYEFDERPIMSEVLRAIRSGSCDALIVYKVNRATRAGGIYALMLAHECERHKVELHFVEGMGRGRVDISSLIGQLTLLLAGDQAKEERLSLLEAMQRGLRSRAEDSGLPLVGRRPKYGWQWVDTIDPRTGRAVKKGKLTIVEAEAAVVKRIYREAFEGIPLRRIAKNLMRDGIPSPDGTPFWGHRFIGPIVRDERYIGISYAYGIASKRLGGQRHKQTVRPKEDRVRLPDGTWPAIIDEEIFYAVQERLTLNKQLATRNNKAPTSTLLRGGYVRCAECGNAMFVKNKPNNRAVYWCAKTPWNTNTCGHPSIAASLLDQAVWRELKRVCKDPELIKKHLREQDNTAEDELLERMTTAETLLGQFIERERTYIRMLGLAADERQEKEIQEELKALSKQREAYEKAYDHAKARYNDKRAVRINLESSIEFLSWLAPHLDEEASYEERRSVVTILVEFIEVWPYGKQYRAAIHLSIPDIDNGEEKLIVLDGTGSPIVAWTIPR